MNLAVLDRLRETWSTLSARERQLALAGGAVLLLVVVALLAWLPLQRELTRLRASVPEQQQQLARMRTQAAMVPALRSRAGGTPPAAGTLLTVVEQSANKHGVRSFLTRLDVEGGTAVQVTAEAVPFNALISWLAELREGYALNVENATLEAHGAPGTVNGRLRLRIENP